VIRRIRGLVVRTPGVRRYVDMNELVRSVTMLAGAELARRDVSTDCICECHLPRILGDSVQFQQLVLNLLNNAAEAMTDNGDGHRLIVVRTKRRGSGMVGIVVEDSGRGYLDQLQAIADGDVANIEEKERAYGSSWKRRGGIGAFMMFARKFDRIEQRVSTEIAATSETPAAQKHNLFQHILADRRTEPLLDDIRDLRRYLVLVEAEMAARGALEIGTARDNREKS